MDGLLLVWLGFPGSFFCCEGFKIILAYIYFSCHPFVINQYNSVLVFSSISIVSSNSFYYTIVSPSPRLLGSSLFDFPFSQSLISHIDPFGYSYI